MLMFSIKGMIIWLFLVEETLHNTLVLRHELEIDY